MEAIYFLIIVGVCAAAITWYVARTLRQQSKHDRKSRTKATYYVHQSVHHPVLHSHTRSLKPAGADMWTEHRQHAAGEKHHSESLTANKIQFDDEIEDEQPGELKMKEFTYTPTEFFESSGRKR